MAEVEKVDILHILDEEIEAWRQEHEAPQAEEEIHMFISDSNGSGLCDAGLEVQPPDIIVSRVEPGRRWVNLNLSIIIRRDHQLVAHGGDLLYMYPGCGSNMAVW